MDRKSESENLGQDRLRLFQGFLEQQDAQLRIFRFLFWTTVGLTEFTELPRKSQQEERLLAYIKKTVELPVIESTELGTVGL